jgi:hypothetical protein
MKRLLVAGAALLVAAPLVSQAQTRRTEKAFEWEGRVAEGRWVYVRNLNGAIKVDRASGNQVEITAEKSWRRGNPDDVRIEQRESNGSVIVCALWYDNSECDEDGYRSKNDRRRGDRNNDTSVEFTVRLPAGVKLVTSTVNGGLEIRGATSEVEATTVNGSIEAASTGGPVTASTVNGGINVRMAAIGDKDLDFRTVNGSIEVTMPDRINADVDISTVNGRVTSDFAMTVSGRINPRRLRGTIGSGGRKLRFSTVNGSVEIRRN